MPLNNYFNIKRFSLLLQQDLLINRTKYLLGIVGLGVITYLLSYWFFSISKHSITSSYSVCFVFYMMAVGVIIGTAFPDLKDKIKTSNFLLSPGSVLEKLVVQFVIRIALFVPIALGIFWSALRLAKASLVSDLANHFDVSKIPYFKYSFLITSNGMIWETWMIVFAVFALFSYGIYLFAGTTYFKRYALIKTVIFSGILFGVSILFSMVLSNIFYTQAKFFDLQLQKIQITEKLDSFMIAVLALSGVSWMFFLAIAYFKLKEKEV